MGKNKDEAKEKALHGFVEEVRLRGKITCRTAIVEDGRKEFFRGKDLMRFCESNPEKLDGLAAPGAIEARVKDLVVMMMSTNTVTACNRFYKRPHPGRKHLVKYPRKLDPRPPNEQEWSPDHFYVWMEDRPMPPWQYALAVLMAVAIFAACLFPLAPAWLRSVVVYFFLGLLCSIFVLILLRFLIFMAIFTFTGYEWWLFPNLLSDQVDLIGAFIPLYSCKKPEPGKSHLGTRIGGFVAVSFMMYAFYYYTPDESAIGKPKGNDWDDVWKRGPQQSLGTGAYQPPKFGTDRNVDVEKIRQARLVKLQAKREEMLRKKAAGEQAAQEAESEEPVIPSFPEIFGDEDDDSDSNSTASPGDSKAAEPEVDQGAAEAAADAPPAHEAEL